jgi:hypothetical protein
VSNRYRHLKSDMDVDARCRWWEREAPVRPLSYASLRPPEKDVLGKVALRISPGDSERARKAAKASRAARAKRKAGT